MSVTLQAGGPVSIELLLILGIAAVLFLVNLGVSVWIYRDAKRRNDPHAFAWGAGSFLGVFLGGTGGFVVGIEGVDAFQTQSALETTVGDNPVIVGTALFLGYLGTTFVSVFFTGALVLESRYAFANEPVKLRRGMAHAWAARYKLFAWAVIAATVGVIIDAVENSNTPISKVFAVVFGAIWTVMTFFIVPIAVLDRECSLRELFTRSGRTFRETVGETVVSLGAPRVIGVGIFFLATGLALG
jgi:hypothetical protein